MWSSQKLSLKYAWLMIWWTWTLARLKYVCMYVCMLHIGTFRRTIGFFAVLLRGPLSLAGPTPVLVKFKDIFAIFRCFRRSSTIFSSVLVKVHFTKQSLTQKIFKMYFYEDHKKYHVKYSFCRFCSCNNYYL